MFVSPCRPYGRPGGDTAPPPKPRHSCSLAAASALRLAVTVACCDAQGSTAAASFTFLLSSPPFPCRALFFGDMHHRWRARRPVKHHIQALWVQIWWPPTWIRRHQGRPTWSCLKSPPLHPSNAEHHTGLRPAAYMGNWLVADDLPSWLLDESLICLSRVAAGWLEVGWLAVRRQAGCGPIVERGAQFGHGQAGAGVACSLSSSLSFLQGPAVAR